MPAPRQNACRPGVLSGGVEVFVVTGGEMGAVGWLHRRLLFGRGLGEPRNAPRHCFRVHVELGSGRRFFLQVLRLMQCARARRDRLAECVDRLQLVARNVVAGFEQILEAQRGAEILRWRHATAAGAGRARLVQRTVVESEIGGRIDLHLHVILADANHIAALQFVRVLIAQRAIVVVHVGAVAAGVLQQVTPLVKNDARMASRDVTHIVGQYPVVLGRASYASARDSKDKRVLVAQSMAMITDDAQPERHVLPSGL